MLFVRPDNMFFKVEVPEKNIDKVLYFYWQFCYNFCVKELQK